MFYYIHRLSRPEKSRPRLFLWYLRYDHLTIGEANPLKFESMFFQLGTSDSVTPTTTENGRHYCHPEVLRTKKEPATVKELSPRLFDDPSSEPIPSSPNPPISRLPEELLYEVFTICVCSQLLIHDVNQMRLRLGRVCRSWRSVVFHNLSDRGKRLH